MEQAGVDPTAISVFERQVEQVRAGVSAMIYDADVDPWESPQLDVGTVDDSLVGQTAMIRLNGGLGTSMGMDRAKSLLPVSDGLSFLDIIARQVLSTRAAYSAGLPLTFLHSFRTSADCLAALARHDGIESNAMRSAGVPLELMQNQEPKLLADELVPVEWPADPELEWCPPGHGDLYTVLHASGLLARLLDAGYRWLFVANSDNLGARVTAEMVSWFAGSGAPFALEAVRRSKSDRKGGHFVTRRSDGRLVLRETAQTPPDEVDASQRHGYSSTNNLWLDIAAVNDLLEEQGGDMHLPVIVNRKTVDPSDASSPAVIQLETAMGAAVESFEGATTVEIGRDRFIPVKTTNDLLVVRSDCYRLADDNSLVQDSDQIPFIELSGAYKLIHDFDARFPAGPPSLIDATSLIVRGDWTFGEGVTIVGDVKLGPEGGTIPDGSVLDGSVATS